jgi:dienelactone hydrolase
MLDKWYVVVLVIVLIVLILPVLVAQLRSPEQRDLQGVGLDEVDFQEVRFRNSQQNLDLGGLRLAPEGEGPFPAAVIIHGSGPSRRDNDWYLTLAQYLQENGVFVLLPDKRGSEASEGDWRTASIQDLATDTVAAIDYLDNQGRITPSAVGVIGMSQGGIIAPVVADQTSKLDFVVNVVGGAVPMHQGLIYEETHNLGEMGFLPGISDLLAYPAAWSLIYLRQTDFWGAVGNFDPLPYWARLQVDALVLYGAGDTNVPSEKSARLLRSLEKPNLRVRVYQGSGHALESPKGHGNSIFREDALKEILDFIRSVDASP